MPRTALALTIAIIAAAAPRALDAQPAAPADWNSYVQEPGWSDAPTAIAPGAPSASYPTTGTTGHAMSTPEPGAVTGDYCPPAECCPPPCAPPERLWRFSVGGLFLAREQGDNYFFSYDESNEDVQYTNFRDADFGASPGFETRFACFDCCSCVAYEVVYSQLFADVQTSTTLGSQVPGPLSAILNFDQLDYNGVTADNFTNGAFAHQVRRDMDFYNVEFNRASVRGGQFGNRVTVSSLAGVRFVKFDESLLFASDPNDASFSFEADELYYQTDVENNLVGFQLGGYCETFAGRRLSLFAGGKAGVFGNIASADSEIGGAAGAATVNNGPNAGAVWDIASSQTSLATLAEFSVGGAYRIGQWTLGGEYRVIGLSGLALPEDQIYSDLRGVNDVQTLENDGSVLFHGATARLERLF